MTSSRPQRVTAQPQRFEDEQAAVHSHAQELLDIRRALRLSRVPAGYMSDADDIDDETDEENKYDSETESEEEEDESDDDDQEKFRRLIAKEAKDGWSTQHTPVQPHAFIPGPQPAVDGLALTDQSSPLDYFYQFIPYTYITEIAEQINIYASQQLDDTDKENRPPNTRSQERKREEKISASGWRPVTDPELLAWFGCIFFMSVVKLENTRDYWSGITRQPFVADTFARNRFLDIMRFLHLSDNAQSSTDRLQKLRPLIDTINHHCRTAHYPSQHCTIDEAMVGFKGRSIMRQHIPAKAHSTGYKVWMLVESKTNYVFNFDIYTGRGAETETGQATRVVNQLIDTIASASLSYHRYGWFLLKCRSLQVPA